MFLDGKTRGNEGIGILEFGEGGFEKKDCSLFQGHLQLQFLTKRSCNTSAIFFSKKEIFRGFSHSKQRTCDRPKNVLSAAKIY